ncbi:metal-dependent hydrolase [Chloroflexota bacterium]
MTKSIRSLGHAGFIITTPEGKTVIIDACIDGNPLCPLKLQDIREAHLALVTHYHWDHALSAVAIARQTQAIVVAQTDAVKKFQVEMGLPPEKTVFDGKGMNIGGSFSYAGITVTMTQAAHSSVTGSPCGYLIKLEDGCTIYHAGDTGIFESMRLLGEIYPIDLALLPIGGVFTMDSFQAVKALGLLKPKKAIPMHYKTFAVMEQSADNFLKLARREFPQIEVIVLEAGEEYRW